MGLRDRTNEQSQKGTLTSKLRIQNVENRLKIKAKKVRALTILGEVKNFKSKY